eukprot:3111876-Amphidinium_carterae.1
MTWKVIVYKRKLHGASHVHSEKAVGFSEMQVKRSSSWQFLLTVRSSGQSICDRRNCSSARDLLDTCMLEPT